MSSSRQRFTKSKTGDNIHTFKLRKKVNKAKKEEAITILDNATGADTPTTQPTNASTKKTSVINVVRKDTKPRSGNRKEISTRLQSR